MRETQIVAAVLKELRALGAYAVKQYGSAYSPAGVPDVLACLDGRFIAIEVKQPKKNPTPIQLFHLGEVNQAGGVSMVVHSVDELREILGQTSL